MRRMLCVVVIVLLVIWLAAVMFLALAAYSAPEYPDDEDPWD